MFRKCKIDEKNAKRPPVKPKERVTLIFKNGSTVELNESNGRDKFEGVTAIMVESWVTVKQLNEIYPEVRINA